MKDLIQLFIAKTNWMKTMIGVGMLVVFMFQAYFLAYHEIPEGNEGMFHVLFGIIDTSMVTLFQYYFGSSKGSQDKQETIAKQAEQNNNTPK